MKLTKYGYSSERTLRRHCGASELGKRSKDVFRHGMHRAAPPSARISANAGVVQRRRRCSLRAKSLKINEPFNAGVAGSALQNRGLQVRFLPGLFVEHEASQRIISLRGF